MKNDDVIFSGTNSKVENRKTVVDSPAELVQELEDRGELP